MKQVTLRLPLSAYENLVTLCGRHGVTFRGVYEAATIICTEDLEDPVRRAPTEWLWETARRLEKTDLFRQRPRRKIIARLDDDIADTLAQRCEEYGVSQNAALGLISTPWPVEDTAEHRRFRKENWERIVVLARRLDFGRRRYAGI